MKRLKQYTEAQVAGLPLRVRHKRAGLAHLECVVAAGPQALCRECGRHHSPAAQPRLPGDLVRRQRAGALTTHNQAQCGGNVCPYEQEGWLLGGFWWVLGCCAVLHLCLGQLAACPERLMLAWQCHSRWEVPGERGHPESLSHLGVRRCRRPTSTRRCAGCCRPRRATG